MQYIFIIKSKKKNMFCIMMKENSTEIRAYKLHFRYENENFIQSKLSYSAESKRKRKFIKELHF